MIDEENEFNKIYDSLSEIESLVDRMYVPTTTMEDGIHKREIVADRGNYKKFVDLKLILHTTTMISLLP